jgi:hypothetical protein
VSDAIASGTLTVDALRNGAAATRALPLGAISPAEVPTPIPASSEQAESACEDPETLLVNLLGALLERREGWFGLKAELPQELLDRIVRWVGA